LSGELQLSGAKEQIGAFVRGLTPRQKIMMAGSAVLVAGLLFFFVTLMNKPDFKPLVSGLSSGDAQSLNAKLTAKGLRSQITADGTGIEVAADQLDKARLEMSADGMPQGARMGFELFDKPNWMGSDFAEKVNYQRALEGELERTIGSLQEVESARVHLVLERESLFTEHQRQAKAAVVLKLRRKLPPEAATSITQLVANSVDGLTPESVSLVDSDGRTPLVPRAKSPFGGADSGDLEADLALRLVSTLEPVVGADHVKANVRVEYDLGTSDETKETYDPNSVVAITMQRSKERTGGAMGGVPGTASNVPSTTTAVPKPTVSASDSGPFSETENATYAVNRTIKHSNQPAGTIKRLSAAVLIDDGGKPRSPEDLKKLEGIARAALGIDTNRGDTLVAESISFKVAAPELATKVTVTEKVTRTVHEWSGAMRIGGVLALFAIVYFLVLRPVKKQMMATLRALPGSAQKKAIASPGTPDHQPDAQGDLRNELIDRVKAEPEAATRLLQTWIRQPEGRR